MNNGAARRQLVLFLSIAITMTATFLCGLQPTLGQSFDAKLFEPKNLVAWCIVPFDAKKRTPEQRAQMLEELGIRRLAYDYRAEHIPTFETEIETLLRHKIELTAWWFPTQLNEEAKQILSLIEKYKLHPQLWVMGAGDPNMSTDDEAKFISSEVQRIREIAVAAKKVGCKVGLYNHGSWFGIPKNQIKIIQALDMENVGIVYNLHHAHDQLDELEANLKLMQPYLLAINLNGTQTRGDQIGKKILPIHEGDRDVEVIRCIGRSGYHGLIGILNHTDLDARERLDANLNGLKVVVNEIERSKP